MATVRTAVIAAALLASACGGRKEEQEAPPPAPKAATAPAPASSPTSPPTAKPAPPAPPPSPPIPADTEVQTMPSGVKYSVLKDGGPGPKPKIGDRVKVHYTGWLVEGRMFDSSRERGAPAEFVLGQVIPGWNQALQEMTPGSRWKITIPPDLGYGSRGAGDVIPPGATLVFDVELLSFKGPPAFRKPDAAAQQKTASGLKYEVLAPGDGPACGEGDMFEIAYALYDDQGKPLQSSDLSGEPIVGKKDEMQLPFLKEAPQLMKVGSDLLFEVPPDLCWGERPMGSLPPKATTIWRLRLVRIGKVRPAPKFEMPPADKLETTPSGLKIWIVKPGEGASPAMGDTVVVDYAGWLTDGKLFDDSCKRGLPATFVVGQLIAGWNEALQRLKPGGEAWLVIPGNLAYGERGQGQIPPNATLVFNMQLHEVRK